MKRRLFLRTAALSAAGLAVRPDVVLGQNGIPKLSISGPPELRPDDVHLVILHTNDVHSRVDPFPMDGGPFQGLGGVARRATLIRRIREEQPNVLLLDAGDTFQGTPYFNFFKGEIEFRAMSAMEYDATTLGNHDFDNGLEGLVEMLPHASFPFVSANYDVSGSLLEGHVEPWIILPFTPRLSIPRRHAFGHTPGPGSGWNRSHSGGAYPHLHGRPRRLSEVRRGPDSGEPGGMGGDASWPDRRGPGSGSVPWECAHPSQGLTGAPLPAQRLACWNL